MVGRPVEDEARDQVVRLRALPEERERWFAAARREGLAFSAWARRALSAAADPSPKKKSGR